MGDEATTGVETESSADAVDTNDTGTVLTGDESTADGNAADTNSEGDASASTADNV